VAEDAELARLGRLVWQTDNTGAVADLAGHFWAMVSRGEQAGQVVWSWMIIGYENQVLAAGQTGDLAVAKLLVEEWNRWVCGPDARLDSTDNPSSIADECTTYQPVWPSWPGRSLSAHLTVGVQIDEADLYVSRKVRASLPNAESLEEDIQRCIHIGLLPAHPDVDIRTRVEMIPAEVAMTLRWLEKDLLAGQRAKQASSGARCWTRPACAISRFRLGPVDAGELPVRGEPPLDGQRLSMCASPRPGARA
jgi:hypothetical protein